MLGKQFQRQKKYVLYFCTKEKQERVSRLKIKGLEMFASFVPLPRGWALPPRCHGAGTRGTSESQPQVAEGALGLGRAAGLDPRPRKGTSGGTGRSRTDPGREPEVTTSFVMSTQPTGKSLSGNSPRPFRNTTGLPTQYLKKVKSSGF